MYCFIKTNKMGKSNPQTSIRYRSMQNHKVILYNQSQDTMCSALWMRARLVRIRADRCVQQPSTPSSSPASRMAHKMVESHASANLHYPCGKGEGNDGREVGYIVTNLEAFCTQTARVPIVQLFR